MPTHIKNLNFSLLILAALTAQAHVDTKAFHGSLNTRYWLTDSLPSQPTHEPSLEERRLFLSGRYNYTYAPALISNAPSGSYINGIHGIDLAAAYMLRPNLQVGADVGLNAALRTNDSYKFGLGDVRVRALYRFLDQENAFVDFGIAPEFFLPTGNSDLLLTNGAGGGMRIFMERSIGPLQVSGNAGFLYFPNATFGATNYTMQVPLALGASLAFSPNWSVASEAVVTLNVKDSSLKGPGDLLLAGRYQPDSARAAISFGMSLVDVGSGRPTAYRILLGATWFPFTGSSSTTIIRSETKIVGACGEKPFTATYAARPLNPQELAALTLPFVGTEQHPNPSYRHRISTLQIGEMTGLAEGNIPYVKDSQIVFAFDITALPARNTIAKIESVLLKLDVSKFLLAGKRDHELLCFAKEGICSGKLQDARTWQENHNPEFFGKAKVANSYFNDEYLNKTVSSTLGYRIFTSNLSLDMEKLLKGSGKSVLDFLYADAAPDAPLPSRTIYLVVGRDSFVGNNAQLALNLREDPCQEGLN